ncbi:peptidylprolyl isomerase [candidate division KSB1 bacterium]|nr:peptidylprolyl isomerase [candidate division KSB1 bacterium]
MKSQRYIKIFLFLSAIVLLSNHCSQKSDSSALATFKGGDVRTNEYVDYFLSSTRYKPDVLPDEANLQEVVTLKALEKMAVLEAVAQGIEDDSLYIESIENNLRKTLFHKYMRQELIDRVITDSLIQAFYHNFTPQYHMSYILRPVLSTSAPEFEKSQRDTIEYVHDLLRSGRDFKELAARYSQDVTTKDKGGSLGFVIRESMGDAALRAAMDTLRDFNWSEPIRGYEGYYILYKGEKRDVTVPPFADLRDQIWRTLYRTRRHDIESKLNDRFDDLADRYHFHMDEAGIAEIVARAGLTTASFVMAPLDFAELETEMGRVLATYDGGQIKLYELFEEKNREPGNKLEFDERLQAISQRHLLAKHSVELGYQEAPDIVEKMSDVRQSLLRSFLHRRQVLDKAKAQMDAIEEQERLTGSKQETDQFRRVTLERQLKEDFEEEMKVKYHFEFVKKNFAAALERARQKKNEQNSYKGETSNIKRET